MSRRARQAGRPLSWSWRSEGYTAWVLAKNTVKLAPDRFLAVYATVVVIAFALFEIFALDLSLSGRDDNAGQGIVALALLPIACLPTFLLCLRDPELYARIITSNVDSRLALRYLARMALRCIREVDNAPGNRYRKLISNENRFAVIELAKGDLASRFGLAPRLFCDQFFRFSPAIYRDRVTKLALNEAVVSPDAIARMTFKRFSRRDKLAQQSRRILAWIEDLAQHLDRLANSGLPFHQVEALFIAESTSGSVQQLAQILETTALSDRDVRLLFDLTGAYRGRSLFRRLLSLSLLHADARLHKDPEELPKLLSRCDLLLRGEEPDNLRPYERRHLAGWSKEISGFVQKCRKPLWAELERELNVVLNALSEDGTLLVVVESYSRAVRTALRVAVPNNERIKVFFLLDDEQSETFGPRLLHHVVEWEDWEENANQVEHISGDLELLRSLVRARDAIVGLSGASGIFASDGIYSTTPPSVWRSIESLVGPSRFCRLALAGSFKLDWERFWPGFREGGFSRTLWLRPELSGLKLSEDTLRQSRDSLTGGLYLHQPVELLSDRDVDAFGLERTDRSAKAREG